MGQCDPSLDPSCTGDIYGSGITGPANLPGGGYLPPVTPSASPTAAPSNFWTSLTKALTSAGSILSTRYAVPQLNPGQLIQTSPYGTSMYQAPAGASTSLLGPSIFGTTSSALPLLLIGGLVLVMVSKR